MKSKNNSLSDRDKIISGMDKVYDNLVEFKKKMNSDMIVLENNRIKRIKPQQI